MRCVAVPVFENGGEVPGGIAISGPASRFDLDKLVALRDVAMVHAYKLSRELGASFVGKSCVKPRAPASITD